MLAVNLRVPLLLLAASILCGCSNLANRRDQYQSASTSGPYSKALRDGTWRKGVKLQPSQRAQPSPLTPPLPVPVSTTVAPEPVVLP